MAALKMVVDGTLILLNVSPVMGESWGRRVADLGYSSRKVSWNMIEACDALNIIRTKNHNNPKWINRDLYRLLYNPTLHIMAYATDAIGIFTMGCMMDLAYPPS